MSSKLSTDASNLDRPEPLGLTKKALLLVNPNSRMGGDTDFASTMESLAACGFEVTKIVAATPNASRREITRRKGKVDLVIVAGGDGTISSTAAAIYECQVPLAILPLGTANDLARSLGIPQDLESACRAVINSEHRRIDLGMINGRYFFNAVTIGLGTNITDELTPELKKTWGVFSYFKALTAALSRKKNFRAQIIVDGRAYRQSSIHIAVGNGRYYGGGNVIDDEAEIDSGLLCLYSIKPQPLWKLLFLAPLLRLGKQRLTKHAFTARGHSIEISTNKVLEIHADGEPVSHTPASLRVIHRAIEVLVPNNP